MRDGAMTTARLPGREAEIREVAEFLAAPCTTPSALEIEGEPGIGKTTLWLAGVEQAPTHGLTVLSARPAAAESAPSHSTLGRTRPSHCTNRLSSTRETPSYLLPPRLLASPSQENATSHDMGQHAPMV